MNSTGGACPDVTCICSEQEDTYNSYLTVTLQSLFIALAALLSIIGFLWQSFQNKREAQRLFRLKRVNLQIDEFVGPLHSMLVSMSASLSYVIEQFATTDEVAQLHEEVKKLVDPNNEEVINVLEYRKAMPVFLKRMRNEPTDSDFSKLYREAFSTHLLPLYKKIGKLVEEKSASHSYFPPGGLKEFKEMFPAFRGESMMVWYGELLRYIKSWEVVCALWDKNVYNLLIPKYTSPYGLPGFVAWQYNQLLRQRNILTNGGDMDLDNNLNFVDRLFGKHNTKRYQDLGTNEVFKDELSSKKSSNVSPA